MVLLCRGSILKSTIKGIAYDFKDTAFSIIQSFTVEWIPEVWLTLLITFENTKLILKEEETWFIREMYELILFGILYFAWILYSLDLYFTAMCKPNEIATFSSNENATTRIISRISNDEIHSLRTNQIFRANTIAYLLTLARKINIRAEWM